MTESELKSQVTDYLQIQQNQGKLMFLRLNSGDFIEVRGPTRRRIRGCPPGTADLLVIKEGKPTFFELKSKYGKASYDQIGFGFMAKECGADYIVARSLEDVQRILNLKN